MKLLKPLSKISASFTVFLLFFGVSLFETFRTHNWINVAFWIAIAIMFLIADGLKLRKAYSKKHDSKMQDHEG